jgi:hypothetical protein
MKIVVGALFLLAAAGSALAQDAETDRLKKEMEKLKADNEVLSRQLEVTSAQLKELNEKIEKAKTVKAPATPEEGVFENQRARESAKLALAAIERAQRTTLKEQEEVMKAAAKALMVPAPTAAPAVGVAPKRALEGKVTAVATEIGLVVISIGKDDGVLESDEFTVYRGGDFVAKIVIDRSDRTWSAGKVVLKKTEPRVADDVSNHIFVSAPRAVPAAPAPAPVVTAAAQTSAEELRSLRKELDDVRSQVQSLSDRILPSWKDAGVTVEEASEPLCAQLQIARGLVVRRLREGSAAARILKANDVIPDRTEAQLMDLFRTGGSLPVRRRGKLEVFQVDPNR